MYACVYVSDHDVWNRLEITGIERTDRGLMLEPHLIDDTLDHWVMESPLCGFRILGNRQRDHYCYIHMGK